MTGVPAPTERLISAAQDDLAPDGSEVRLLGGLQHGSLAHFTLGPKRVARAVRHATVEEIWYVVSGLGLLWRLWADGESQIELRPGTALTIPVGTVFQFRNTGLEPLTIVGSTMPPWPGPDEAKVVDGPWTPTV